MGYAEGSYRRPIWIPIVVGLVMFVIFFRPGGCNREGLSSTYDVEQALFNNPDTGRLYKAMQRTYPADFTALENHILAQAKSGVSHARIEESILNDVAAAQGRHRRDILQSPHDAFARYRAAEIRMLESLRDTNRALCATYVATGAVRISPQAPPNASVVDFGIAAWEAFAAGRDRPAKRILAAPAKQDFQTVRANMVASGIPEAKVTAFFDETTFTGTAPADQCAVGIAFYRAIDGLPGEKSDAFYAYLASQAI